MSDVTTENGALRGQKFAYATASLIAGLACFINMLGMEKAALAIFFGVMALRAPVLEARRSWAKAGLVLGILQIGAVVLALLLFREELAALLDQLRKFN